MVETHEHERLRLTMDFGSPDSNALDTLEYRAGLSRLEEAVISSHFMDAIARNAALQPYDRETLVRRSLTLSSAAIDRHLIPALVGTARSFAVERAARAVLRARQHFKAYCLPDAAAIGESEVLAEVLFDRQFSRKSAANCSRRAMRDSVRARLADGRSITLAIPALPFKILSPLKARGTMPDLAEVGFLLSLSEIALALEAVPRCLDSSASAVSARFVVISDGLRFAALTNTPEETIARYREGLVAWISRLGLTDHVVVEDYRDLFRRRLPTELAKAKQRIFDEARRVYAERLAPLFDPCAMKDTLAQIRMIEPDPEEANADGRFVSLLHSLVYTVNYRTLEILEIASAARYALYRELTASLFTPLDDVEMVPGTLLRKEGIRRAMLHEVWQATIDYMAEIKSDRDLDEDPILACLPGAIRWTIHAKAGQLAIAVPSTNGTIVQAWAGSGVFRRAGAAAVRLCAYPVLGLEGDYAVPVMAEAEGEAAPQPLFYIDREVDVADAETFVAGLADRLTRSRLK